METEVILKRELFSSEISQKSKSEFFSLSDLIKAGNKWRALNGLETINATDWLNKKSTKEFIHELELKYGKVYIPGKGRGKHSWAHPLLFIDLALFISPKLKVEVYEWIFDKLIKLRNDSGDSYKDMCGALFCKIPNSRAFSFYISKVALSIKNILKVEDWNSTTQEKLDKRDKIHVAIKLYCNVIKNPDNAVKFALKEYCPESIELIDNIDLKINIDPNKKED